ncbi:MAG: bifunctional nuclease family protein, partial [Chloroflexi bacterium]|nr:bifunctional nuclease family protein [Chloroflexota bacterium]
QQLIDSRPSDAIALAVRASVPIYVEQGVLDKAGITVSPEIREQAPPSGEDELDVFRDFVDGLDLGDLGE